MYYVRPLVTGSQKEDNSMKILVCGGRDYDDTDALYIFLDNCARANAARGNPITHVIHGGARGADSLAGAWARARGTQEVICPANWEAYGRRAGVMRNGAMTALGPDLVIAFPGGNGTAHMIEVARVAGLDVYKVE